MQRNLDSEAAIIANDLDSLIHRIEMLQAHPKYTDALLHVSSAKDAIRDGRSDIHQRDVKARHDRSMNQHEYEQ